MLKRIIGTMLALVLVAVSAPAFADNIHIGNTTTNQGGQGGQGGAGGSAAAAASASSTNVNTNINTQGQQQGQHQGQGQQQGQIQGQGQGQKQQANNDGNHQSTKFEAQLPVGLAIAPGLTAAGTGVCLGSVSIGLSGPFAGASFGITKVDKGCEQRSSAALLYQMGYKDAAVRLLMKNDDVREALGTDAPKVAGVVPASVSSTTPSIPLAMAATQAAVVTSVQGN